uniref:Uncharacterized protein n=1 Tax=Moniliophthora roreri TaxID=221103 RepID=A0A0W0FI37_MONRR
MLNTKGKLLFS